jgi:rhodanese-related sulfurtransferase
MNIKQLFLFSSLLVSLMLMSCESQSQSQTTAQTASAAPSIPFENVDAPDFKKLMANPNTIVIDVRTPGEIAEGKIEGALEMDFYQPDFKNRIQALDKDKTYLIYCRSGGRSQSACQMMNQMGFKSLYNLRAGFTDWEKTMDQ